MKYLLLASTCLLASCAVGPDYEPPSLGSIGSWIGGTQEDTQIAPDPVQAAWWHSFNDPVLTGLVQEAAANNLDIKASLAALDEAKALRRASIAPFFPSIDAGGSARREGLSQRGSSNNNTSERERDSYALGLDASWEPDIFGGIRRSNEAAAAREEAQRAQHHDIMLATFAELARNYFELRGIQKRIEVNKHTVELLGEVEGVADSLFENGVTSEFDLTQARGERESAEAALPNLEAEMMAGIYRISVLTGKPPEHHLEQLTQSAPLPMPPDTVPVGLRSEILRRRPDVRRAERELAAATADIGVATAELFPRFPLTGSMGASARSFSDLFTSGGFTYFVAQAVTMPIFAGGALSANIDAAGARAKQARAEYEKTVLSALEDAESSLVRYGKEWQTLKALRAAEATRKEAYDIARLRYESGDENFLVILDAERSLTTTRDAIIQSETRILTHLTQLYKALGGGWEVYSEQDAE